ncbi:hypothetical protein GGR52DRAFT_587828 [Hypoxylon sp. FL1284]|nr:hypothetical protein GGR52DRAFT_587828 [Hypoxylon sp. FL1284]
MAYRGQNYSILVEKLHRVSSEEMPPAIVSNDSYYGNQPPSSQSHNASYASYAPYSAMAPNRTPEGLMDYQGHSLPPAQVAGSSQYYVRGHHPADVNLGSSGGASYHPHTTDHFELPYYQAVAPESRTIENAEMYHHGYPHGYGAAVTSPPTSSTSTGSSTTRQKNASSRPRRSRQVLSPGSATSSTTAGKASGAGSSSSSASRLRSASRTSKNTHHNPPASAEEQKSRETHNQVEKQYRNRLNAHFESLLEALPETMQAGEGDDEGEALDLTDRRVSKAEVLDMARRHIQALERQCAALEGERDELRNNMARLRWLFGRGEGHGAGAGFDDRMDFPDTGPMP